MNNNPTAIIADDEPLLAQALSHELAQAWPELTITTIANNGTDAITAIKQHQPDIAFLDIRMPGASGIEVAEAIAEDWPDDDAPPLIVFVTAFDDYAIQAFDSAAIDYLLKPVKPQRLMKSIERIKQYLHQPADNGVDQLSSQVKELLSSNAIEPALDAPPARLRVIPVSSGDVVRMIPVEEIIFFESADKYVSVHTRDYEGLIREPLRKLLPQLDQQQFVQIHRGTIVNMHMVEAAVSDDSGKVTLRLKQHKSQPVVSRLYRHLFKAM